MTYKVRFIHEFTGIPKEGTEYNGEYHPSIATESALDRLMSASIASIEVIDEELGTIVYALRDEDAVWNVGAEDQN